MADEPPPMLDRLQLKRIAAAVGADEGLEAALTHDVKGTMIPLYVERLFHQLDEDGGGTIGLDELRKLLERLWPDKAVGANELARIMSFIDTDGSGEIELDEFQKCLEKPPASAAPKSSEEGLNKLRHELVTMAVSALRERAVGDGVEEAQLQAAETGPPGFLLVKPNRHGRIAVEKVEEYLAFQRGEERGVVEARSAVDLRGCVLGSNGAQVLAGCLVAPPLEGVVTQLGLSGCGLGEAAVAAVAA
eukprot:COSAG04_NODE_5286_length_1672_cov_2.752066_1_plen_246_part_10